MYTADLQKGFSPLENSWKFVLLGKKKKIKKICCKKFYVNIWIRPSNYKKISKVYISSISEAQKLMLLCKRYIQGCHINILNLRGTAEIK